MRPGDLFVLRNAGNTCAMEGSGLLMGSVEYAISVLGCKLIVVNGHTQCGAVTGAVQQLRNEQESKNTLESRIEILNDSEWCPGKLVGIPHSPGNGFWVVQCDSGLHVRTSEEAELRPVQSQDGTTHIKNVLQSIMSSARKAFEELPGGSVEEQVKLATKYNVYNSMKVFMLSNPVIMKGVLSGEIQLQGAIYDLRTSAIEWLGQHPELESIVGCELPLFQWKTKPYVSSMATVHDRGIARQTIDVLGKGNKRFTIGKTVSRQSGIQATKPSAIVLASPEINFPIESMFDAELGSIVVQRTFGGLQEGEDMLQASIEYMVLHFQPSLILVLGDSNSKLIDQALEQIHGMHAASSKTMLSIFSGVLVSALRARSQAMAEAGKDTTMSEAARQGRMKRLAVELHALYTIEQLLLFSPIIREAVVKSRIELHVGLLDEHTGEVEFIGEHPMQHELIAQKTVQS